MHLAEEKRTAESVGSPPFGDHFDERG